MTRTMSKGHTAKPRNRTEKPQDSRSKSSARVVAQRTRRNAKTPALDPAALPDQYIGRCAGTCMEPEISDGAPILMDKREPVKTGDFALLYFKPEHVPANTLPVILKRVVLPPPRHVTFPWREHPETEGHIVVIVETLNPPRRIICKCEHILAIHKCLGPVPLNSVALPKGKPSGVPLKVGAGFDAAPSRRALIRLLATSAAVLPVVGPAVANTEVREVPSSTNDAPTPIGKLAAERERVMQEAKRKKILVRGLNDELERLMPKPHPSIVFSADNDADGLNYYSKGRSPHTLHGYFYPNHIEEELRKIVPSMIEEMTVDGCSALVFRNEVLPPTPAKAALKDRLAARLELSKKYERKIQRMKSKIGLTAAYKAWGKLTDQQLDLEQQILSARCTARSDFAMKLAIYDYHGRDGCDAEAIIEDLRRLLEAPTQDGGA